jgi:serine/threonine protein kinase/Flp pilus assembly protein TadD
MTDRDLLNRALVLLGRVFDLDDTEREVLLDRECGGDADLRALVDELLEADETPDHDVLDADRLPWHHLLETGVGNGEEPGEWVGPYRLLKEAGRGGMATVYLAEREVGSARQRVALKLVRRGIDTDEALGRFAHETRVLASLEHPNIARFHDAGVSDDGRPFLVMEFIEGRPITRHCDEERLSIADRLELFRTVCEAVQFAHQRLVVHRDIKPSNVLVTGGGEVRLVDFGIAKLLVDEPDVAAPRTRTGLRVLTPEYAAPEQLRGQSISTATDVYALGLVLYEVLTGYRARVAAGEAPATRPPTSEFEPVAPSTAVRRGEAKAGTTLTAGARRTTADRLVRRLRGDLDRITLKALETDPARRYSSAREFGEDIERHLKGLPIRARPDTLTYRVRTYSRRHRVGVAVAVTAVVSLISFGAFHATRITRERDVAQFEAEKARTTTQFLQRLLGDAYPSVALGDTFSMGDLLARAVARVDSLSGEVEVQAELLRTLGDVYREQGRFDEALPLLERAVAIHQETGTPTSRAAGQALDALGHLYYERGEYEAALRTHRRSLETFRELYAPDDSLVLFALNNVATAASALENYDEALEQYRTILALHARLFSDTSQLVHVTRNNVAQLYHSRGDFEAAVREFQEALRLRRIALPPDHPSLALTMNNLGTSLERLGRLEEAEAIHRETLDMFRRVYGPDHHRVGLSAYNLARVLREMGRYDEAESLFRLTLSIDRTTYGDDHLEIAIDLRGLGLLLVEAGDCDGAIGVLRESDAVFARNDVPLTQRHRMTARANLASCLSGSDRHAEAEELLRAGLAAAASNPAETDSAAVRESIDGLVELYIAWGRLGAADSVRSSPLAREF